MSVEIARTTVRRILARRDVFVIQVQRSSDPDAAMRALYRVLESLSVDVAEGPKPLSGVFSAPSGPFVLVDGGETSERLLRKFPEMVAAYLSQEGLAEALVTSPQEHAGPLFTLLNETPLPSVCLRLYPPSPRGWPGDKASVPGAWLEEARSWVTTAFKDDAEVLAEVDGVEFSLRLSTLPSWWRACRRKATSSCGVADAPDGLLRGANGKFAGPTEALSLAGGRSDAKKSDLVSIFQSLREVARRLAPEVGYAFVSFDSGLQPFARSFHDTPWWTAAAPGVDPIWAAFVSDEAVFDLFPYQVLGPGHLARLGTPPEGVVSLAQGRAELAIGDPLEWLTEGPGHMRRQHRQVLSPCLLRKDQISELIHSRRKGTGAGLS